MLKRRDVLRLIPASTFAYVGASTLGRAVASPDESSSAEPAADKSLLAGPPVVQHLTCDGFSVSVAVRGLATAWVEWGRSAEQLDQQAIGSRAGLVCASDRALIIPVPLSPAAGAGQAIYYRVVAEPLRYETAYKLHRGDPVSSPTYRLVIPDAAAPNVRIAVINDTHDHAETVQALAAQIDALDPQLLVWNGDACASAYDTPADPPRVLLSQSWATTRPLLFVPGNHDVRGAAARTVRDCLAAGPDPSLPYNVALRYGPVGLVSLDTAEDKPDAHPVFAGTAAYEPYRARQAVWLREALARPEIATAPFKVAICHIPLHGLPGHNDGLSLEGFAYWSGDGARKWMPILREAGVPVVVSGHMHAWRIDDAVDGDPVQVVGGGPNPKRNNAVTVIVLEADAQTLSVTIRDAFSGAELAQRKFARR